MRLAVSHLVLPKEGEQRSGDAVFVRPSDDGGLFAVIDALGHGDKAAATADVALEVLAEMPADATVLAIIERLHVRLRGTRGAAAMICAVQAGKLTGCGVGNVDLASAGTRVPAIQSPGILGASLNRIRIFDACLAPGDRLALFSDGIAPRFDLSTFRGKSAEEVCRALMERNRRPHDDATVLIADLER